LEGFGSPDRWNASAGHEELATGREQLPVASGARNAAVAVPCVAV